MIDLQSRTLGDLVADNPATARALDRLGLDYCCHGERSLVEACEEAGLDPASVAAEIDAVTPGGDRSWAELEPSALADHIAESHHRYLYEEMPLLEALAEKVLSVHGERHAELVEVRSLVAALWAELEPHLRKEERILFPATHELAGRRSQLPSGALSEHVRMLMFEHDRAGRLLVRLRAVTDDYTVPTDGCASYRSLFERLAALEADTHVHIHKENHTLFPAALRLAGEA